MFLGWEERYVVYTGRERGELNAISDDVCRLSDFTTRHLAERRLAQGDKRFSWLCVVVLFFRASRLRSVKCCSDIGKGWFPRRFGARDDTLMGFVLMMGSE